MTQDTPTFPSDRPARTLESLTREISGADPQALPVEDACRIIGAFLAPVQATERVALRDALGRVLADDVISPIDVPAHDNSAMDGYAVMGADLDAVRGARLSIIGTAYAGIPFDGRPSSGQAVRVMTGAVMPEGCDTVVVQELARTEGSVLIVPGGQEAGQNRRLRGEDLARGRPALSAGKLLTPADLGLVASLGQPDLVVRRRLRVAFFSTGDEVRSIGETLGPGQIYDSNRYTLFGMLTRLGVDLVDMGVVRDSETALEEAMRTASASADAVISSGGVSVGEADFTRDVMGRLGDVAFWKIAMRPGRPMAFGRVGNAVYFGLPGNPVAVMVTFYFFVRNALRQMMGATPQPAAYLRARTSQELRKKPGRTEYQRAILSRHADGSMHVRVTGSQGSGVLRSMSEANCIVVLHHGQGSVPEGGEVDCLPFDGLI